MRTRKAFFTSRSDKGRGHRYDLYYDSIFKDFTPNSILEIGIKRGNSLAAWKMLFPKCNIYGLDITDAEFKKSLIEFSGANITIGDSTKAEVADKFQDTYDVIVDDGSHYYKDIMKTFKNFHTKFGKYYVIEDYFYDQKLAEQYINSFGYTKVHFFKSHKSTINAEKNAIYRTSERNRIDIDQALIVIER